VGNPILISYTDHQLHEMGNISSGVSTRHRDGSMTHRTLASLGFSCTVKCSGTALICNPIISDFREKSAITRK